MTAFRYAVFYGIYGPLIGAAVLFLVVAPLSFGIGEQSPLSGYLGILLSTIVMSIWIVPFAFLLGVLLIDSSVRRLSPNTSLERTRE